jgi:hypothetical protein
VLGIDFNNTSSPLVSKMIPTLMDSTKLNASKSFLPLLTPSEKVDTVLNLLLRPSNPSLLEPPWIAWLGPSGWLTNLTPDWTETRNSHTFYNASYADSSSDPHIKAQAAMTASILHTLHHLALSPFDKALCELFSGAFFFAMRSCEYVEVT